MKLFADKIKQEIDTIREKFPKDKSKSSIIESLLVIQHDNNGYLTDELMVNLANYLDVEKIDVKMKWNVWQHVMELQ